MGTEKFGQTGQLSMKSWFIVGFWRILGFDCATNPLLDSIELNNLLEYSATNPLLDCATNPLLDSYRIEQYIELYSGNKVDSRYRYTR